MIAVRESVNAALKAALIILLIATGISGGILLVQSIYLRNPARIDSDSDGFTDLDELSWWTSELNPYDNPMMSRILPLLIAAAGIVLVLILGNSPLRNRLPDLAPALRKKVGAMRAAVCSGNPEGINACKADFDTAVVEIREGPLRGLLQEPLIQEILVEFEVLCLDARFNSGEGIKDRKYT